MSEPSCPDCGRMLVEAGDVCCLCAALNARVPPGRHDRTCDAPAAPRREVG